MPRNRRPNPGRQRKGEARSQTEEGPEIQGREWARAQVVIFRGVPKSSGQPNLLQV